MTKPDPHAYWFDDDEALTCDDDATPTPVLARTAEFPAIEEGCAGHDVRDEEAAG